MSTIKCRLCLCLVDKQIGFSCSLKDDTFCTMLKTVFPFPISSVHTAANKTYNMPASVCLLCATTVRNFFDFSQKVAAVQKQLEKECSGNDDSMSISELLQLIKTEPVEDVSEPNANESLDMSVDIQPISMPTNQKQNNDLWNLSRSQSGQSHNRTSDRTVKPITCIDKNEVVESIVDVERRVNYVATRLEQVLRNSLDSRNRIELQNSFDFNKITNKEECTAFNDKLAEKAYMDKILDMVDCRIKSNDGKQRMYVAFDLFFCKSFVPQCSWTGTTAKGVPRKIAFICFRNIVQLFQLIGTTNQAVMSQEELYNFFKIKLRNAKGRMLRLQGLRDAYYCRPYKRSSVKQTHNSNDERQNAG
ncbi:uncharacterized protein LOC131262119 isoform X2 [Anopheles coustani]|uniref:uncharacterized protein LOC131262119 isoform X2 n=2 Tax=coustani group TaxID=59130 RepID=UPI002658FDF0|nr:uncharacterized protein LOC131262119 isoform X2 [Anopheles coustani]